MPRPVLVLVLAFSLSICASAPAGAAALVVRDIRGTLEVHTEGRAGRAGYTSDVRLEIDRVRRQKSIGNGSAGWRSFPVGLRGTWAARETWTDAKREAQRGCDRTGALSSATIQARGTGSVRLRLDRLRRTTSSRRCWIIDERTVLRRITSAAIRRAQVTRRRTVMVRGIKRLTTRGVGRAAGDRARTEVNYNLRISLAPVR